MTTPGPTVKNLDGYGTPPIAWARVHDTLFGRLPQEPGAGGPNRHTNALTAEFSAPSAGPPPWAVYRLVPERVFAFGTAEPYGATRFDLPPR
ncbi:hypothetical protein [Cellulosimicrobium sp. NPDC055967]|uniref:hypothetical protein n=1 Tax=Cellulosimicrobium sp. NPDC055967 TaxID=3345670 RepID=UPI0035D64AD5